MWESDFGFLRPCGRHTINQSVTTLASDVADNLNKIVLACELMPLRRLSYRLQAAQVSSVEGTGDTSRGRSKTLHQESNTERVETRRHEVLSA